MSEPIFSDHADIQRAISVARQALIEINMNLVVYVHHETEREWLVSQDNKFAQWISKAEASLETDTGQNVLVLPMALAIKKGFI